MREPAHHARHCKEYWEEIQWEAYANVSLKHAMREVGDVYPLRGKSNRWYYCQREENFMSGGTLTSCKLRHGVNEKHEAW